MHVCMCVRLKHLLNWSCKPVSVVDGVDCLEILEQRRTAAAAGLDITDTRCRVIKLLWTFWLPSLDSKW